MINLILYGILGLCVVQTLKKPDSTGKVQAQRSGTSIQGHSGTVAVNLTAPGYQGPSSGAGQQAGNANQPWYNGALVSGAGVAGTSLAKGLAGLFSPGQSDATASSDVNNADTTNEVDDADLEQSEADMAQTSYSATEDNEDPSFDYSDSEYV